MITHHSWQSTTAIDTLSSNFRIAFIYQVLVIGGGGGGGSSTSVYVVANGGGGTEQSFNAEVQFSEAAMGQIVKHLAPMEHQVVVERGALAVEVEAYQREESGIGEHNGYGGDGPLHRFHQLGQVLLQHTAPTISPSNVPSHSPTAVPTLSPTMVLHLMQENLSML
eukprot:gene28744-37991_t